jgi:hypothetical protein
VKPALAGPAPLAWLDTPPRAAGRVESGPGAAHVHLAFLLGDAGWSTACLADHAGLDAVEVFEGRQVRPVLAPITCPDCTAAGSRLVDVVNDEVAALLERETAARELLAGFLAWAASECPIGDGGAVLAVYDGSTWLHAMRPDERERTIAAWLEETRRYPGGE